MFFETAWTSVMPRTELVMLEGHTGLLSDMCWFEAGGRTLVATASWDATVMIWDPVSGRRLGVLRGHSDGVVAVLFVGGVPVSAGKDATVRVWDPIAGVQLRVLTGYRSASLVEVGGRVLVASRTADGAALWDPATGQELQTFAGAAATMNAIRVGGRVLLAACGGDAEVGVWDADTGDRCWLRQPDGRRTVVVRSVPVGDRTLVASAGYDKDLDGGRIRIWDPVTGRQINELRTMTGRISGMIGFEVEGRPLLAGADSTGQTVRVWDPLGSGPVARHRGHTDEVYGLWRVGGGMISIAEKSARIWNPATGGQIAKMSGRLSGIADVVEFTVDGRLLLAAAFQVYECGRIRIWDPATGRQVRRLERRWEEGPAMLCPFTVDDRVLLAAGDEESVRVWDPRTGRLEGETSCGSDTRWLGRITLDGRPAMAGWSNEHGVRIFDPAAAAWRPTGAARGEFAFMLGERPLVADVERYTAVRIRDLLTGETRFILSGHTGSSITGIGVVALRARTLLATCGGTDRTVRLWDSDTAECALTIPVHHEVVGCAQVGEDLLAVAVPTGVLVYRVRGRPVDQPELRPIAAGHTRN